MKESRIHVRVDEAMKRRLAAAVGKIKMPGVDEAAVVRGCLIAFVEAVEEHGGIFIPITLKLVSEAEKNASSRTRKTNNPQSAIHGPNEPPVGYGTRRKK